MNQGSKPVGQVVVKSRGAGTVYAIRFRAQGKRHYVTLGYASAGWDRRRAEAELQNVLADVRRGIWRPPAPEPAPAVDPTFHEFASQWFKANRGAWRESTCLDYEWQLRNHLLPFFKDHRLTQITIAEVDRYRQTKVDEGALSAASINKTITRLGQILDVADERELIPRNPVRVNPRNRKLKESRPAAVWLDRANQIEALLDAAAELDREAPAASRHIPRRTMIAVLAFGGLRLGEMLNLRWRDVDLAAGRLRVSSSKTDAGERYVDLLPPLREALTTHRMDRQDAGADTLVFATGNGTAFLRENFRDRVFTKAVELADQRRAEAGLSPLPEGLTPHKLRHTAVSLWFALGWDLPRVMKRAGHSDSATTLRIYAHVMEVDETERAELLALVGAEPAVANETASEWVEAA